MSKKNSSGDLKAYKAFIKGKEDETYELVFAYHEKLAQKTALDSKRISDSFEHYYDIKVKRVQKLDYLAEGEDPYIFSNRDSVEW